MTIQVTCNDCFRTYGVKDQYAGRRIKCPDCGAAVQIPDGSGPPPADEFGGDELGDGDFASAPASPPRSRSRKKSSTAGKSGGGSSLPVLGIILGLVGVFVVLPCCGGIIWFAVNFDDNDLPMAAAQQDRQMEQALAGRQLGGTREESGRLGFTDDTLESGEYFDEYTLNANMGDMFVVDLYSDDFDPYLMIMAEDESSDFQLDNDDFGGETNHSQLIMTAPSAGSYRVVATSFESGETGAYELKIREMDSAANGAGAIREETGTLEPGDETLDISEGEYTDIYTVTAQQGDLYVIDLHSDQFDTYLLVTGPGSFSIENDDFDTSTNRSQITLLAPETGKYEINATSFEAGETGSYRLTIQER